MSKGLDYLISTLKDSLKQEKCVLILGPEVYIQEIDGHVWERKEYFAKLEKEIENCVFFPNDGVFKTPNRFELQQKVKDFYTGGGDNQLLESISAIRFPLIINASPDESLSDYLQAIDKEVQFDYFEGEEDEKKIKLFDKNKPLIYNTFGKASDPQSLILSHEGLYKRMQQILPIHSFPTAVREFLKRASSFLFLGFKFDSWAYQLLSYKIISQESSIDKNKVRLSSSRYEKGDIINVIMTEALGINFTDLPPIQLLNSLVKLIDESKQSDLLRSVGREDKFASFISYSRKSSAFIGSLVSKFNESIKKVNEEEKQNIELKLLYDKEDLRFGQSIDSFMTRIGRGKTVVLVVSQYFLESEYCMIEALRTNIYHKDDERVFIILITNGLKLDLTDIAGAIAYYQKLWEDNLTSLIAKGNKPDKGKVVNYLDIRDFIPNFIQRLSDTNNLVVDEDAIDDSKLGGFILQLIDKMRED